MENASSFFIFKPQDLNFQCYTGGPMWTTCTACTFVSKLWNPLHDYNSQSAPHLRSVWIPLHSPTLVRVCLSLFPTYFNYHIFIFIVSPKIRSQHWKLTFTHFLKIYLFLSTDLDDFQFCSRNVCFSYFIHEHINYFIFTYFIFIFRKLYHIQYS